MSEAETLKLLSSLGAPGLIAWIMWMLGKRYMDAHAKSVEQTQGEMGKRIDALEAHAKECEADRRRLNERIVDILTNHTSKAKEGGE